jgi:hypothetical protein
MHENGRLKETITTFEKTTEDIGEEIYKNAIGYFKEQNRKWEKVVHAK